MSDIFFSAGYYFSQVLRCQLFFPRSHLQNIFFSEIIRNLLKSQIIDPKIQQTFAQKEDSDLSIKAF